MTKNKSAVDKNLQNVVKDLDTVTVNAHHAQQVNQQTNDRRHERELGEYGNHHAIMLTDKE